MNGLLAIFVLLFLASCSVLSGSSNTKLPFDMLLTTSDMRALQIRVWPPGQACQPCETIIFSHGHNLSNRQYDVLLSAWASAGYLVLAPLHADSESHPHRRDFQTNEFLGLRLVDFDTVVDTVLNEQQLVLPDYKLSSRYFAAGHSFGALIAQMAGGAQVTQQGLPVKLGVAKLPAGIIALSPPGEVDGYLTAQGWRHVQVPQLIVTGTHDVVPLFAPRWQDHLVSFEAAPPGGNFSLVFEQMDHYFNGAFGRITPAGDNASPAVAALNQGVLVFADMLRARRADLFDTWSKRSSPEVKATVR